MTHDIKNIINMIKRNDSCTIIEEIDHNKMAIDIIKKTPSSFKYANDKLKNDIELVSYVVENNADMYEFIGDKLKNNKQLALCALKSNMYMIKFIGSNLKQDEKFIREVINSNNIKNHNLLNNNMVKSNEFNTDITPNTPHVYRYTEIFFMGQTKGECVSFSLGIAIGSIIGYYIAKKK